MELTFAELASDRGMSAQNNFQKFFSPGNLGTPPAGISIVENVPPYDIENLLARLAGMEKELASLKDENTRLKFELARKDKIIAGLQQRLFGSSSEWSGAT